MESFCHLGRACLFTFNNKKPQRCVFVNVKAFEHPKWNEQAEEFEDSQ